MAEAASRRISPSKRSVRARTYRPTREQLVAYTGLVLAVSFVVLVTYLPHLNTQALDHTEGNAWTRFGGAYADFAQGERDDYPYPLHVDEPVHWGRMAQIQRTDTLRFPDVYTGAEKHEMPLSLRGLVHETGYWVTFAAFQEMTGISFPDLIRMVPALWTGLTAALVFAAVRPWKGAPLAAAMVAFIPTTPRFLGPAFFVPIGFGLAWVALALVLMKHAGDDRRTLLMLLLVTVWAFFIHLIAGFAILVALLVAVPFYHRKERRNALLVAIAAVLPLVWLYEGFQPSVAEEFARVGFLPTDYTAFDLLGIPFLIAWILGVTWVAYRTPTGPARIPILTATVASVITFVFIIGGQAFDLDRYALYDRWHQPFALFAAIPVAYALVGVYDLTREGIVRFHAAAQKRGRPAPPHQTRRIGIVATLTGLLLLTTVTGIVATPALDQHLREPYYHILTPEDYRTFQLARDLPDTHEVFLSHPWKAPIYTAMTGREPHTWLTPGRPPIHGDDYATYVRGAHRDDAWLIERGITIILAVDVPPDTAHYHLHPSGAWVLDAEIAKRLHEARER